MVIAPVIYRFKGNSPGREMATQVAGNIKYQTVVSDRLEKFVADLPVNRSPFDS